VTISVNDTESKEVSMLLGHSGEAYFVGEVISGENGEYGDEIELIDSVAEGAIKDDPESR
jgi:hypothetical protein